MNLPILGQFVGLVALGLCIAAFASKRDDRLLALLIFANIAFAVQFFLLGGVVAGAISSLIVLRIWLVRRYKGNPWIMAAMLLATVIVALPGWQDPTDAVPLAAGLIGTVSMFMLRGIPMRAGLAAGAACWMAANYFSGSAGALAAEGLILATNAVTIARMARANRAAASGAGA